MTEEEWLTATDPIDVLRPVWTSQRGSERHLRLFAVACCLRASAWLPTLDYRRALSTAEQFADGTASEDDLFVCRNTLYPKERDLRIAAELSPTLPNLVAAAYHAASAVGQAIAGNPPDDAYCFRIDQVGIHVALAAAYSAETRVGESAEETWKSVNQETWQSLTGLVREIFGNPFRPVAFDPAWRTSTAVALARQMYDSRDFGAMPILADALQDAGCEDEAILNHCRDANQPHVRGCWVCDLVLGKE